VATRQGGYAVKRLIVTLALGAALLVGCIGDGTHVVGRDIQPGTYQNSDSSAGCYWERLSGFGGTVEEIIANGFTYGQAIVSISLTDAGFTSARCGFWTRVADAPTVVPTVVQPTAQPTQIEPTRTPRPTREPTATPEPDWNLQAACRLNVEGFVTGSFDVSADYVAKNLSVRAYSCDDTGHCMGGDHVDFSQPVGHQSFTLNGILTEPRTMRVELLEWHGNDGGAVLDEIDVGCS